MNQGDSKNKQVDGDVTSQAGSPDATSDSAKVSTITVPKAVTRKERAEIVAAIENAHMRKDLPSFGPGDTVKVHAKIIEGNKERVQIFEGVVIEQQGAKGAAATFTVRKISYNVGVERKFFLHSPRIEKIEVVSRGDVRRAKLYYLRGMRGKAGRIKSRYEATPRSDGSRTEGSDDGVAKNGDSSASRSGEMAQASA